MICNQQQPLEERRKSITTENSPYCCSPLESHKLCESTIATRWHCFTTVPTSATDFDSFTLLSESLIQQRSVQRCASNRNSLPFHMHCLCICYPFCLCLLCVSTICRTCTDLRYLLVLFFCYLVLLDHPILLLFWRWLPGDHDGGPIVPALHHCNLTRWGAGGWGE